MISIQGDEFVSEANTRISTPQLRLVDFSVTPGASRTRVDRIKAKKFESRLFSITLAAIAAFVVISGVTSIVNLDARLASAARVAQMPTRTVVVQPGDTLWRIASRYGDPNVYILDRVEAITNINHMSDDQSLVAGQKIRVPIFNKSTY